MPNLQKKYKEVLAVNQWQADDFQQRAVSALQNLLYNLKPFKKFWPFGKTPDVKGVYLYGGVGRGKSMLMDLFFDEAVKIQPQSRRVHFHEFMIETHDWLHAHRGEGMDDLLPRYAAHVSNHVKLLCFDEFHVTDVADAMILGRLFTELFGCGLVVVATSNWVPDDLYEGGLTRDRFLPFIKLLNNKMNVTHLDSDVDYRTISNPDQDMYYFYPLNKETKNKIEQLFFELTNDVETQQDVITVRGRDVLVNAAGDVAQFTFSSLCKKAYGAEDYIAIAKKYDTVFLTQVPSLTAENRNETKRFILLIDCLYEAKSRLIISAETNIESLYQGGEGDGGHGFEFNRTVSRLMEMQSALYHEERA